MTNRLAECHPTRPHLAKGLCEYCYKKSRGELPYQMRLSNKGKRAECHPNKKHYAKGLCVKCYNKRWKEGNPDKKAEYYRKHRRKWVEYTLRNKFDLSLEEYEVALEEQGGVCAICGNPEDNGKRLSVDHNHDTGSVRGLLCQRCNTVIGMSLENKQVLRAAIRYLDKYEE